MVIIIKTIWLPQRHAIIDSPCHAIIENCFGRVLLKYLTYLELLQGFIPVTKSLSVRHLIEVFKHCSYIMCDIVSLSTIVLNSRDWSEIIWLPRNLHFKINLPIGLYLQKPAGMHWLGRNDAVP